MCPRAVARRLLASIVTPRVPAHNGCAVSKVHKERAMCRLPAWARGALWLLVVGSLVVFPAAPRYSASTLAAPGAAEPAPVGPLDGPLPQTTRVRFGSPGSVSDAGVYLGEARGYFRE